jgi:rod shape-determining protein MreC
MEFLLSRYRNLTALVVVIMAQLVLLAWQVKSDHDVRLIRVWAVSAVTPLARVLEFVREHTIGAAQKYFVLVSVREDNHRLNEELGRLKIENQFLRNELSTAERVQALQAFQNRTPSRTLPARIIGTGTGANSRLVFIDQGSGEGVMRGMAVVTPDGIVGKVLAAYPTASQVLLITDPTFAAGVISEKNRVHGTLKGIGQSKVIVDYVQNEEKVEAGEMFYTSGDDRIFPKGMPVGRATVVRPATTFKEIYVVPTAFQHGLEEVLVVIEGVHGSIPDTRTPASQDVYIMPPPPAEPKPSTPPARPGTSGTPTTTPPQAAPILTEADRVREQYKRIGEAQGHTFGEGAGRVPNFNINPDAPKPRPAVPPGNAPGGGENRPPGAAPTKPAPPAGSTPGANQSAPTNTTPRTVTPGPPSGDARRQPATGSTASEPVPARSEQRSASAVPVSAAPSRTPPSQ